MYAPRTTQPPRTQTEQYGKMSLCTITLRVALLSVLVPTSPKSALSSESYRITPLATAGAPTLSIGARILGTPCDLKRVTCARKVATNAGRPSRPGSKQSTKIPAHPPTHPVQLSYFETGASKRKPGQAGQKSNQLLDNPGSPPTDQSNPRNS